MSDEEIDTKQYDKLLDVNQVPDENEGIEEEKKGQKKKKVKRPCPCKRGHQGDLEMFPTNQQVFGEVITTRPNAVADMWDVYNMEKRISAVEGGIAKLTSMIQDLLQELKDCKEERSKAGIGGAGAMALSNDCAEFLKEFPLGMMENKFKILDENRENLAKLTEWMKLTMSEQSKINELFETVTKLSANLENVMNEIEQLKTNREDQQSKIMDLLELLDLKADKVVVEDALVEKADAADVNSKVSHDQFDAACDDLTKGVEDSLQKVEDQDAWIRAMFKELQEAIDMKLDKGEIEALKDFICMKYGQLEAGQKVKTPVQEVEAAGTKLKVMRNLNCVSCNKEAFMKMENEIRRAAPALLPSQTNAAHVTYERSLARRPERSMPPIKQETDLSIKAKEVQKQAEILVDHVSSRYCGGSHTVTTPQQRTVRVGNFIKEFGPTVISLQQPKATQSCPFRLQTEISANT